MVRGVLKMVVVVGLREEEEVESSEVELDSGKGVGAADPPRSWMMKLRMFS